MSPEKESRRISYDEVDRILRGTPKDVLNLIAGIVKNMCRKLNVPEDETNEYVSRIRGERKMGYFFENMEKMDIQEERRLRKEAEENAEKKIKEAQKEAMKEARKEAQKEIQQEAEKVEGIFIETLQELSLDRSEVKDKIMRKFALDEEQAEEKMKLHWKESE